ncbi:SelB C-terminal domain-containing protein [Pseudomonas fluorescens]|nr:SelB C-terminal domain-containing protein [Pseudomonas fluorescens]AZZ76497.1 hypothetical protein CCX46_15490 [Pseudomonas sp. RU47]
MAQGYVALKTCLEVSLKRRSLKGKKYLEYFDRIGVTRRIGESR